MPVFIYADDIEKYAIDRGSLMWNLSSDSLDHVTNNKEITPKLDLVFPFSVSTDNEELEKVIDSFDESDYRRNLEQFNKNIGLVFDGKASDRLAEVLAKTLEK